MRVFFERDLVQRSIEAEVRDVIVTGNRSVGLEVERAKVLHYLRPPLVISLGHAREPRSFFRTHPSFPPRNPSCGDDRLLSLPSNGSHGAPAPHPRSTRRARSYRRIKPPRLLTTARPRIAPPNCACCSQKRR